MKNRPLAGALPNTTSYAAKNFIIIIV